MSRGVFRFAKGCVFVLACAFGASAQAAVSCNGCTVAQVDTLAASLGRGDHYIYDLTGNHFYMYTTECEPIVGGITCYAYPDTPPADMLSQFNSYHQAWMLNNYSEAWEGTIAYNVPSGNPCSARACDDGYVNAYDTLYFSTYQNTLANYIKDPSHYSGTLAGVMAAVNNLGGGWFDGTDIVINVVFHDGSKRQFHWDKSSHTFKPTSGTAIDADTNTLPEDGGHTPPHGYLFDDSSNGHHYDPGNVAVLLGVAPPDIHETYYQCAWVPSGTGEGGALNCVGHTP